MALSISEIRQCVRAGSLPAELHAQIEELKKKEGSNAKPFWELKLRDASDTLTLRVWSDSPNFQRCEGLEAGNCVAIEGEFYQNGSYGMDSRRWEIRTLTLPESAALFAGSPEAVAAIADDLKFLQTTIENLQDPRLSLLGLRFLELHGTRFARAAAARFNHHARRGGLASHTAQMMRTAVAILPVYPTLNGDLLCTGVLFHDVGKLWETCPAEEGFSIPVDVRGELMGHISIGVEVINSLWRDLPKDGWDALVPASESVRLHLLHLILAHHGELEFGSPVTPKTPEAMALHFIDNLDARLEMLHRGYETSPEIAPGVHDRIRPLNINPVTPLSRMASE